MVIIVMGVSGAGKSTVGRRLARDLHWDFVDADTFHSPANIEKMSRGLPLTDADRLPWLWNLRHAVTRWLEEQRNVVLACSALKSSYREILMLDRERVSLVYLKGTYEVFEERLSHRQHHFMPNELLQSQLEILEEPRDAVIMNAEQPPEKMVQQIRAKLKL